MGALAIFGITNDGLNLAVKLLLLFLVAIWFALVWWTYADARRRVGDAMLVTCATFAAAFFPFVGSIVYAIVRPPEYLEDARERELEIAATEARLLQVQESTCPHCGHDIEKTFLRCPHCTRRLKEPCVNCARPLDPRWQICPYCEAEVAPPAAAAAAGQAQQRRRGRRSPAAEAERSAPARQTAAAREPARERPRRDPDPRAQAPREPRSAATQPTRETRVSAPDERPARVLPDPGTRASAPDPSARATDATAEQPRQPRPSTGPA
ncbi:MAG TPA: zinc ribbon domain-containing protein [Thermoleophilaceae bacterium]